jgi:hypothetical protein
MSPIRRPTLLSCIAAVLALHCVDGRAGEQASCSSTLTSLCTTRATAWKLFSTSDQPLADVALVIQDLPRPPQAGQDSGDALLRALGERVASVMRANGVPTRYAGHVARRLDAAALPDARGASHVLVLVPAGAFGSDGGADYVALLQESSRPALPIFQSSMRLGKDLRPRFQDISTTELVNALAAAGLVDAAHHTLAPIALFGS